jgi:hypothetical protein
MVDYPDNSGCIAHVDSMYSQGYISNCCGAWSTTNLADWKRVSTGITVYIGPEDEELPEDDEWNRHTKLKGFDGDFIYIKELLKGYEVEYNEFGDDVTENTYPFPQEAERDYYAYYNGLKNPKETSYCSVHLASGWKTPRYTEGLTKILKNHKLAFFIVTADQFQKEEIFKYGIELMDRMPDFWRAKSFAQNGNYPDAKPNLMLIIKEINHEQV